MFRNEFMGSLYLCFELSPEQKSLCWQLKEWYDKDLMLL